MTALGNLQAACDIVIPTHNAAHWVDWCIDEVIRHDSHEVGKVILIDDGSQPEQSELIKQIARRFHKILFAQTPGTIHGFGVACNYGTTFSSAPYVLFLNTDCLLTEGCIGSLLDSFSQDSNIVLACPVSNNSPTLTLPMIPGCSYIDMNRLCKESSATQSAQNQVLDACTIVGNCLMVRRDFFDKVEGFDAVWGKGYGEETDLHMKAFSQGLRGVAVLNSYVYHFGSGTFCHEDDEEQLRKRNYSLFMSKWDKEFQLLEKKCAKHPPIPQLKKIIHKYIENTYPIELDILFYLPSLNQSTGGIHIVIGICNALIRAGIRACCAIVGDIQKSGNNVYQEPMLFEALHYPTNQHFLADKTVAPKLVASTLFTSATIVCQFASARGAVHLQFIQGYEAYFDAGRRFNEFIEALQFGNIVVTTSLWLEQMIRRHLPPETILLRLPLGINEFIFYPENSRCMSLQNVQPTIGAALRSSPDKGQGMVLEVLDRLLARGNYHVVIFRSAGYAIPSHWPSSQYTIIELPAGQLSIARYLRRIDIFLDASLHEGFGLMPLEALACGCWVVCSDSGGIRDFVKDGENGFIVKEISDPERYLQRIKDCLNLAPPMFDKNFQNSHSLQQYVAKLNECVISAVRYDRESWLNQTASIQNLPLINRFYGKLLLAYMKIKPHLPQRIHSIMKAFLGK